MRFERDAGTGFARVFPETFAFRADRHDPAELYLQLDDLLRKPRLLSPRANRRDAEILISRLVLGVPRYLERVVKRLEVEGRLEPAALTKIYEDVALIAQIFGRFVSDRSDDQSPGIRMASFHLRKLASRSLLALVERRVDPAYLAAYVAGSVDPVDPADDLSEAGFFYTMESGESEAVNRCLVRLAERAFYRWLEDVCLDEENRAFEGEDSPFEDRESEVLRAISHSPRVVRGRDLIPFLRRPDNRDCLRVLGKLEAWFLRQYDVHHAAAMIHHADQTARSRCDGSSVLSRHTTRNYLVLIGAARVALRRRDLRLRARSGLLRRGLGEPAGGRRRRHRLVLRLPLLLEAGPDLLPRLGAADRGGHHRRLPPDLLHRRGLGSRHALLAHARVHLGAARLHHAALPLRRGAASARLHRSGLSPARARSSCSACCSPSASA